MTWWKRLRHGNQLDDDLEKELCFHVDRYTDDLVANGYSREEARREARLALGGPEQLKEDCRDARGTRWMEDLWRDSRYALRALRQRPGFTAVALLTLALGTGATTVMFTVINSVLLKPLAYRDPDRLAVLWEKTDWSTTQGDLWAYTYNDYLACKQEVRALDTAAWLYKGGTVTVSGNSEYIDAREISADLFPLLGVSVVRGRPFQADDDRPGAAAVAILSYPLWQRLFGGSQQAIGATVTFDEKRYTVIGVTPPAFRLSGTEPDLLTPLGQSTSVQMQNRQAHGVQVMARLRPSAPMAQAREELAITGRRLAAQFPDTNKGRTFIAQPLRPAAEDVESTLWLLLGAVGLVLLIACVNVANILLARAVAREGELARRAALGAGRRRLIRQCLTESAVLGICGGLLGVMAAAMGVRPFVAAWPGALPRADEVHLDWHVLLFAIAVSLVSGILFGLAPALRVPARNLEGALRAGTRSVVGNSQRLHGVLVISEIALAVVLLVSAGILGRTMLRLSSLAPGLNIHNVLVTRMALAPSTLTNPAKTRVAWDDVLRGARSVPGVESVALVDTVPMREGSNSIPYGTTAAMGPEDRAPTVLANSTTPDYLRVMGIPLLRGRYIDDQDRAGRQSVAVVDEVMARQAFGGRDPIGQHLWIGLGSDPVTIVGVVGHVRQWGPANDDSSKLRAQLYYPFAQVPDPLVRRWSELMSIAVRTRGDPLDVVQPLQQAVRGVTGDQVLYQAQTMEQLASASIARQKFLLVLFSAFAGLALVLASIGIYGVLAYLTSQRVPEIGVRMALGARGVTVMQMVMGQSLTMVGLGAAAGTLAAVAAARVLERFVQGVQGTDPLTFALMLVVLILAAIAASLVPARRASHIDPMKALRQD